MKKVFDNGVFCYKTPIIFKDKDNKKWFIRYATKYPGDEQFKELKEYGRLYTGKSLNLIKNLRERATEFKD
ncbi:hypothetical protein [Mucilaginibacter segetis]|uniref:Uncharacterized protein n=1 Tax=Mucilaginibacter segetis TaxID=2793071 RepID=A0A934PVJ7_9SPHI|nr:hypothetical protein [Mucilaginibacter segetis]MBK0380864.1 hypothetical protein [Mucilaginibacter segetis]